MARSKIDLINAALNMAGDSPISNLDDEVDSDAVAFKSIFDSVMQTELARYNWNFAEKIVELIPLSESPPAPYKYAYNDPDDRLGVLKPYMQAGGFGDGYYFGYSRFISGYTDFDDSLPFANDKLLQFENQKIYAYVKPLQVIYQRNVPFGELPEHFKPLLEAAFYMAVVKRQSGRADRISIEKYERLKFDLRNRDNMLRGGKNIRSRLLVSLRAYR